MYAFGGKISDNIILKIVQKYDPITDTWNEVVPMNIARFSAIPISCQFPEELNL